MDITQSSMKPSAMSLAEADRGTLFPNAGRPWRMRAMIRRFLLTALVLSQATLGTHYALAVLPYHGGDALEIALAALFALLFTWISIGFWFAIYGFFLRRMGGDSLSLWKRHHKNLHLAPMARTAIVMPIYHEPVERTLGGLRAVYLSLKEAGMIEHFDFFICSDSRNPDIWLSEQATWYKLCQELGAEGKLFYRRRSLNMRYKSGNIADFLRRWGRNYTYTVVLDADSLMDGRTLVDMVRLMELEPRVGILQTGPTLINGKSLFARVQQFASQVYGPLFTVGLAALQLGEAAYWGHNAIIRTQLFMRHCGLRQLSGPGIFGGPILSHDFVEAAYMGRAGYETWLEPALSGSYEESPPTLVDDLTRDKRWAKGNLQHLWLLLFEPKLRFAHRMAFLNGVMSYCASPLWLIFLGLSTVEVARLVLQPINYFPSEHSLFPTWPEWHPETAIMLAVSTGILLFLPKLLAFLDILFMWRQKAFGGFFRLFASILLEIVTSILMAPIRMLSHTRYVIEALLNVNLAWAGQNRTQETGWWAAFKAQGIGSLSALAWAGFAFWLDEMFFLWSLPVAIPLIFAAPISVIMSRAGVGLRAKRLGLLITPEERYGNTLVETVEKMPFTDSSQPRSAFVQAVVDPVMNYVHGSLAVRDKASVRINKAGIKQGRLQQLRVRCLEEGPSGLTSKELSMLALDRDSLQWLHEMAWRAQPESFWGDAAMRCARTP
ncbi:Membrane glycosyltransferase [gamma proteobacterium HdN1]|nr:Membrane glycosyltransferase [gamma proteobacterium HdN1]